MKLFFPLIFIFLTLTACSNQPEHIYVKPLIALPLQPTAQQELALKRLSDILNHVELTEEQKAELHFQRGVRYDAIGLSNLAVFDFNQSLKYKADYTESYNYLGVYYTLNQEYPNAYDAFDSVLELDPNHSFALFNRGIALYYGLRAEHAVDDLLAYNNLQPSDAYRAIWLYLAEKNVNTAQAKERLEKSISLISDQSWAKNVALLYLDKITLNEYFMTLPKGVSNESELAHKLCEAYFYLAKYYQEKGLNNQAKVYFKLALTTNVYEFVEHRYAQLELTLTEQQTQLQAMANKS